MERKICSTRSMVSVTGCRPPVAAPRPGSETSSRSEASRWASRSARIASMRALSCASMRCLTWLSALPRSAFSAPVSEASPLSSAVSAPLLPRKAALASASPASSATASKRARASSTSFSRSFIIACASCPETCVELPSATAQKQTGTDTPAPARCGYRSPSVTRQGAGYPSSSGLRTSGSVGQPQCLRPQRYPAST